MIRAAVLGSDVSKSRSPAIHNAAFKALGIAGEYVARSVDAAGFVTLVRQLRADGYRYLNVTIPHKDAAAALADQQGPEVRASGAANTLLFDPGRIRAETTDGAGARLRLVARRPEAAQGLRDRLAAAQQEQITVGGWTAGDLRAALSGADVLVSAVPAAAWAADDARAGLDALSRATAVLEMAYGSVTPLAQAARAHTDRYADGLGMLVHQAAHAITLALGEKPPLPPLFAAVRVV